MVSRAPWHPLVGPVPSERTRGGDRQSQAPEATLRLQDDALDSGLGLPTCWLDRQRLAALLCALCRKLFTQRDETLIDSMSLCVLGSQPPDGSKHLPTSCQSQRAGENACWDPEQGLAPVRGPRQPALGTGPPGCTDLLSFEDSRRRCACARCSGAHAGPVDGPASDMLPGAHFQSQLEAGEAETSERRLSGPPWGPTSATFKVPLETRALMESRVMADVLLPRICWHSDICISQAHQSPNEKAAAQPWNSGVCRRQAAAGRTPAPVRGAPAGTEVSAGPLRTALTCPRGTTWCVRTQSHQAQSFECNR